MNRRKGIGSKAAVLGGIAMAAILLISALVLWGSTRSGLGRGTVRTAVRTASPQGIIMADADYGPLDLDTSHWKTYRLSVIGMKFQLPPQISAKLGHIQEKVEKQEGYSSYCLENPQYEPGVSPCEELDGQPFSLGATSTIGTSKSTDGRSLDFNDIRGFYEENGIYYFDVTGSNIPYGKIPTQLKPHEIVNSHGVHMLKLHGKTSPEGSAYFPTLDDGTIAALINTNDTAYPGIAFRMKVTPLMAEQVFDQILSTFTFTK